MQNTKTLAKYFHPGVEVHDGKAPRITWNPALPPKAWRIANTQGLRVDEDGNVVGLMVPKMGLDGETPKLKNGKPYLVELAPYPLTYIANFNLAPTSHDKPDAPNTSEKDDIECPLVIPEGYELAVPDRRIDGDDYEWGAKLTVRKIGAVAPVAGAPAAVATVDLSPILRQLEILSDRIAVLASKL